MKFLKELRLKALDPVLLVALVFAAFLPIFLFSANSSVAATEVVIKAHGSVVKTLSLSVNQKWTYDASGEINKIQVLDRRVRVYEANCRDLLDVKAGWKSKNGDTIVCLPHSLVIQLTNGGPIKQDGKVVDYQ